MKTIIVGGFACLFNQIANGAVFGNCYIAVPPERLKTVLSLMKDAFAGKVFVSKPNEVYDHFTGTNTAIRFGDFQEVRDDYIILPVDKNIAMFLSSLCDNPFDKNTFVTNAPIFSNLHVYMQAIVNSKRTDLFVSPLAYYADGQIYNKAISLHHVPNGQHPSGLDDFWNEVDKLRGK